MAYAKPEINTLGEAASVICDIGKSRPLGQFDTIDNRFDWHPAYDLDEELLASGRF